jgi:phosphate-selective porin OprO/OprP
MNIRNLSFVASLVLGLGAASSLHAQPAEPVPAEPSPYPPPIGDAPSPADQTTLEPAAPPAISEPTAEAAPSAPLPAEVAVAPKPAAGVTADEKGFALAAPGTPSPFVLKLKLIAQLDARKYFDDYDVNDTMVIRRLRPILAGTIFGLVDYQAMVDFAGSQAVVNDAYADIHPTPWLRFRYGKFKTPIGLERLQSDPDLTFMERALTQDLAPDRDIGLMVWGDVAGGTLSYYAGVFNGSPDSANVDQDNGKNKDLAGRILIQPFKDKSLEKLGALGVGFSATYGKRNGSTKSTSLSPLRDVGRLQIFQYLAAAPTATPDDIAAGTVYAEGEQTRLNPQLFYFIGGFGILGEAIWSEQKVRLAAASKTLTHTAWHATLSYVINGKGGLDGATPNKPFDPSAGELGALELGARYEWLKFDKDTFPTYASPNASVRQAQGFGFAANWVLTRQIRIALNLEQTKFKAGAAMGADKAKETVLLGRVQVAL